MAGTSVLSHFLLLGGTSSILRTFLGGTSEKIHPVDGEDFDYDEEDDDEKKFGNINTTGCLF